MWIDEPGPTEKDFQAYAEASAKYHDHWLAVRGVKLMLDGVIDSGTAAMLDPYEEQKGNKGKLFWKPDDYIKAVIELSRRGIPVSTHAIGDRAIRLALEAYEKALKESGHSELRHKIEHVECIAAEDFARFNNPPHHRQLPAASRQPRPGLDGCLDKKRWPEQKAKGFCLEVCVQSWRSFGLRQRLAGGHHQSLARCPGSFNQAEP